MIVGLVVVLLLCPCLGVAGWFVLTAAKGDDPSPVVSSSAGPAPNESAEPTTEPTTAAPTPSRGDQIARGDCVVNDGTASDADLRKVPCGPGTYEVLLRIPATTDGDRCETLAPQSNANYVHDNSVDLFDYVLCLKKRS
ncbi:hypothetical protein [Micromonospora sp. NPDC092111]|uniref:LppU/SCO3897 family protein n=1 Tax=Micromonospora sp. NPDC092111 TaxID=3364289 RepID=UPI00380C2FDA